MTNVCANCPFKEPSHDQIFVSLLNTLTREGAYSANTKPATIVTTTGVVIMLLLPTPLRA